MSAQNALTQSTVSTSTVTNATDYLSTPNEIYYIITGPTTKSQTTSYQQLVNTIGPLDGHLLEIGQNVLLSTQENINFVHEIFRQVRKTTNH